MDLQKSEAFVKRSLKLDTESNDAESSESNWEWYEGHHDEKQFEGVMNTMRNENVLCNVILRADDGCDLPAHKMVLAARSSYFHTMFTKSEKRDEVYMKIEGVSHSILKILIDYIYTDRIKITSENLQGLLTASDRLEFIEIHNACCNFMRGQLTSSNCLGTRQFAEAQGCFEFVSEIDTFIEDYFSYVVERDEFRNLAPHELAKIISSDNLRPISEEVVFEAVLAWINVDPKNRQESIAQLIEYVRLPFLSREYLIEFVQKNPMIEAHSRCRKFVEDALDYQLMGDTDNYRRFHEMSSRNKQRKPRTLEKVLLVVGGDRNESLCHVEFLDFGEEKWYKMPKSPVKQCCSKLVVVEERVYSVGGSIQFGPLRSVNIYDVTADEWLPRGEMNIARMFHGVAVLNNHIYAIGGIDDKGNYLNSVEVYNPKTNKWEMEEPMQCPRANVGVGVFEGLLYVFGGMNEKGIFTKVEHYNPEKKKWQNVAPLLRPKHGVGASVFDGILHVFGGEDPHRNVWFDFDAYHSERGNWIPKTILPFRLTQPEVAEFNNDLYIIGNRSSNIASPSGEYKMEAPVALTYSSEKKCWQCTPGNIQDGWSYYGMAVMDKPPAMKYTQQSTRLFKNNIGEPAA